MHWRCYFCSKDLFTRGEEYRSIEGFVTCFNCVNFKSNTVHHFQIPKNQNWGRCSYSNCANIVKYNCWYCENHCNCRNIALYALEMH